MKTTTSFSKLLKAFNTGTRRIVSMGGTSSGKTYAHLQLLLLIALKRKKQGVSISIVSETLPHLRLGAMRDFENILKLNNLYDKDYINKSEHTYYFGKSYIEFFSADSGKATGPRRNILYLNECNNIGYDIVSELEQRTDEIIFYDFNPTSDFWISEKVFTLTDSEYILIKSNYKDNEQLSDAIKREIELKASRSENYKRIHIDVEFGVSEGLIFKTFGLADAMPEASKRIYGMDFGFTNDPTTLIDIRLNDGKLWVDELLYRTGMTNPEISGFVKTLSIGQKEIRADSSEPKSIEEIYRAGVNIKPAVKGPDSVRHGIELMKQQPIMVTKRSLNYIKELRNYKYKQDKNGVWLNEPIDLYNHCIDPTRYGLESLVTEVKAPKYSF